MKLNSSHAPQRHVAHTNLLDKTRQPGVDLLPNSQGCIGQATHHMDGSRTTFQCALSAEIQLLQELIESGQMTANQQAVIMHDQATTGMTIAEILIARGWL